MFYYKIKPNGFSNQWKISETALLNSTSNTIDCSSILPNTSDIWEVLINATHYRDSGTSYLHLYGDVTGTSSDCLVIPGGGNTTHQTCVFWLPLKRYVYLMTPSNDVKVKIFGYRKFN